VELSLNPVTIKQCSFEESFEIAAKAGYSGIGLRFDLIMDYLNSGHTLEEVRNLLSQNKLVPTEMGFLTGWQFHNGVPLAGVRERGGATDADLIEKTKIMFKICKELNCRFVTAFAAIEETGTLEEAVSDFRKICDMASEYELNLMLEFTASAAQINNIEIAWEIIKKCEKTNCGLLLDTFLLFLGDSRLDYLSNVPVEKIFAVHISDAKPMPLKKLNIVNDRLVPGDGVIPLSNMLKIIKNRGYDGYITVEIFNDQYLSLDPLDIARTAAERTRGLWNSV